MDLDLLPRLGLGVADIGSVRQHAHADDELAVERVGHADFGPELITHPRLALGDAIGLRLMVRVDLAAALRPLVRQTRDRDEFAQTTLA